MTEQEFQEFEWDQLKHLYDNGLLKDHQDCKNYLAKYFVPTTCGTHIKFENNKPTIINDDIMKRVYLKRFKKDIKIWYETETIPKKLICDPLKPTVGPNFINYSPQFLHKYAKYDTFSKKIQKSVDTFLAYVKLIWANNDEKVYTYLLKWFSNLCKGVKNRSCLYAKGEEGIGKSTLTDFLINFVIGKDLFCKGKADHLKGMHNLGLLGKLLVVFEELQFFGNKEWMAIDSEIKDLITNDDASYTDKYEKRFTANNNNNYIVNTNFNAIKGANGRRYLVCDINPCKMNDFKYFGDLKEKCFNLETGHALFCYLLEIDTTNFNSLDIPITQAKQDICAELLTPLEKFLKFAFLLRKSNIDMKVKDLYNMYTAFCVSSNLQICTSIQKLAQNMRELGFNFIKDSNGYNIYRISNDELKSLAIKKKWLHELDKDELDISNNKAKKTYFDENDDDDYNFGIEKNHFQELDDMNAFHNNRHLVYNDENTKKILSMKLKISKKQQDDYDFGNEMNAILQEIFD